MLKFCKSAVLICAFLSAAAAHAGDQPAPREDLMGKNDPAFVAGFHDLYTTTWGDGAIPKKYKELTGASISVVERCETCLRFHLRNAKAAGATAKEAIEALRIGVLTGGSITLPTVRVGYDELKALGMI